ncbi:MAG: TetR family transcriptional regulator C-terminal domain-containing protein [Rhodobacterales bacterium]|nr:TetR family transcriptional regulator C-terminal domain-containing protein [Rhodobacterales bacterium]
MDTARRAYRRESEETRRADLVAATQGLVAEGGAEAATVRAIAARAGVTAGLIRHYFQTKDELIRAAYRSLMDDMTAKASAALAGAGALPEERLAAFVAASLRPPVLDIGAVVLWAGYMHKVRSDADLLAVHEAAYLSYRDVLQGLIATLPRTADAAQLRSEAIACNAVIDGLWLEGSILSHSFDKGEIVTIGLRSVGAILGVNLLAHCSMLLDTGKTTA